MKAIHIPLNERRIVRDQAALTTAVEIVDDYGAVEFVENRHVRTETRAKMWCEDDQFALRMEVQVVESGALVWSRESKVGRTRI